MTRLNPNQFGEERPLGQVWLERARATQANWEAQGWTPPRGDADASIAEESDADRAFRNLRAASQPLPIAQRTASVGEVPASEEKPGFYRKNFEPNGIYARGGTQYEYHVPNEQHAYDRAHLSMHVVHRPAQAEYSVESDFNMTPEEAQEDLASYNFSRFPSEEEMLRSVAEGRPRLFGMSYRPGSSTVDSLFGTKRGQAHVGTMLGIAARDTAERFGRTLSTPDDLSPHSARLVKGLKGKGLVPEGADDAVTNDYDFYDEPEWTSLRGEDRIPDDEVAAGRSTMRSVLRAARPRKPRETYTQERLL